MVKILESFRSLESCRFVWFCGILTCEAWGGLSSRRCRIRCLWEGDQIFEFSRFVHLSRFSISAEE